MEPIVISNNIVRPVVLARFSGPNSGGGGGAGTVTTVSVTTANGVSGTVANATTTPAITITLGAITPTSVVASGNIQAANFASGATVSGANTGDQDLSGLLVKASNLSDLTNAATARTNLGLGTAALSAATDFVAANAAITGATKTKITYDAKGLVTSGADATTADIADSLNRRYVTDAQLVVIGNTSGTNTGDQTITLTGDVTGSGTGSFATVIPNDAITTGKILNNAVTLAKIATQADATILGNNTGGAASPIALTAAQTKTLLSLNNVENTALSTWAGTTNIITVGTIGTGAWQGTVISPTYGGTGVNNGSNTITLGNTLTTSGNFALTLTQTGITNVTLPTTGTLATLAGSEVFTNKTLTSPIINVGSDAAGDIYYRSGGGAFVRLGVGSDGDVLTLASGLPSWAAPSGGPGGTPGGADTQIQYNDGGAFGGIASFVYNDATDVFTIGTYVGGATFVTVDASGNSAYSLKAVSSGIGGIAFDATASGASGTAAQFNATNSTGLGIVVSTTGGTAIGVTTTGGQLFTGTMTNATTNVATDVIATFGHNSSGSVANNFGARIELQLETTTTADVLAGYIQWDWSNAAHASRTSFIRFYSWNASAREMLRLGGGSDQVTFPSLGTGVAQLASGVLSVSALGTGRVAYGSGSLIGGNGNFVFTSSTVRLAIGISSASSVLHLEDITNTVTNDVVNIIIASTNTTGTPANGLGAGVLFKTETSTTQSTDIARVAAYWVDVTHASRTSALTFQTVNNAGSLTERFRVGGLASKFSGGIQLAKAAKTADYTMLESDTAITSDATGGVVTITLPPATLAGHIVFIKRIDASANNTTVSRAGSDTIEGNNTVTLAAQYDSVTLMADGTATWYIISTT